MRTVKIVQTGAGPTTPVVVDYIGTPTQITWSVYVKNDAKIVYSIQYTHDDIYNTPPNELNWWVTACNMTTHANHSIDSPVRAVRMVVLTGGADGTQFTINQGVAQ